MSCLCKSTHGAFFEEVVVLTVGTNVTQLPLIREDGIEPAKILEPQEPLIGIELLTFSS